jgi:hypothetical protein
VADPWQLAIREDQRWPTTEVAEDIIPVRHRLSRSGFDPVPAVADLVTATGVGIGNVAALN